MIKARSWPVRAMYMLVAAALVISLMITAAPAQIVSAADSALISRWDRVTTPSQEGWVLAPSSTIVDYAVADEGKVAYAIVERWNWEVYALADDDWGIHLLKSTDHAATWRDITSGIKKEIEKKNLAVDYDCWWIDKVACAPDDPDFVAVAVWLGASCDELRVFISKDGGTTFRDSGVVSPNFDTGSWVTDFAVSPQVAGEHNIAIGGTNSTTALLFRAQAIGDLATGWIDATAYDGWDDNGATSAAVVAFLFAPSWTSDKTVLVVTIDDWGPNSSFFLQSGTWGMVEGWNAEAGFKPTVPIITDVDIPDLDGWEAGITTPSDYSGRHASRRYVWVNVNYYDPLNDDKPTGTIFRVRDGSVTPVLIQIPDQPWLTNVSYLGTIASGKAIAGLLGTGHDDPWETEPCQGVQVYRNDSIADMEICCLAWKEACKPPTGSWAMEAFYVTPDKAYAVALWDWEFDEGAWSWSFDDGTGVGNTWNQLSLVDTWISFLSDVAVSLDCNKTMLVSINYGPWEVNNGENGSESCDSVWLHAVNLPEAAEYSGKWLRTWCEQLQGEHPLAHMKWGLLRLNPEETTGDTVYLVDVGNNYVYYNGLETLACWEEGRSSIDDIIDLAVKDASTIYALGLDGYVAMSDDYGVAPSWTTPVDTEIEAGWSIALWGDDVIVGGQYSNWNHSADGGETWGDEPELGPNGLLTIAFDSYYDINSMIYAAIGWGADNGIYRWVIGESEEWTDLRAEPYDYTGLVVDNADGNPMTSATTGGVLYASYVDDSGELGTYTGVARQLTPAMDFCCDDTDWDYLIESRYPHIFEHSLFAMAPRALKICGCLTPDSNSRLFAIGFYVEVMPDNADVGPQNGYYPMYHMKKAEWGTVWTWEDCFAKSAPTLSSPADGTLVPDDGCCEILPFLMEWSRLCDACEYEIEIALDSGFTQGVMRFPEYSEEEIRPIPATAPSWMFRATSLLRPGTTYYWRIRSLEAETGQVIRSWWSTPPRTFTTSLFAGTGVTLTSPETGATDVPRTNVAFTWSASAQVDSYNWVLSPNADLSSPVDSQTDITGTAHTFTDTLAYDTPYYWRVTGIKDGAATSMGMGTFRTMAEPVTPPEPEPVKTPVWVWVIIAIGSVLVIVVIVLIFRTRRV